MKKIINKKTLLLLSLLLFLPLFSGCFLTPSVNQAPTITSTAMTTATVAAVYAYNVNATDPDGDTLTYSLTTKPTGMTINSTTGVISWTPTSTQLGNHSVTVEVSDGSLSAIQSFIIKVSVAPIIPSPTHPTVVVDPVSAIKEITAAKAIADVAVVTGDAQTLAGIKTFLGTTVIMLVGAEEVAVPVTWGADTTPGYDNAAAATYVLTGTIGTLPAGYVDAVATIATVPANIVVTDPKEITAAKAIADVAVVTGDGTTLAVIKTNLGDTVILLVGAEEVVVPVTWGADTTPGYDNAAAATYVLTGTIGTLPTGYVDVTDTIATVTVNIVVADKEITAAKAIADVAVVTGDGTTLATIKTNLGDTVILLVGAEEVVVPVTWGTDTVAAYNNAAAATYVLTGTIGTLPVGYVDAVATIATVTVDIVVTDADKEITSFTALTAVDLDTDEHLVDLTALKESVYLPIAVTVTDGTTPTDATITDWTGTFDGTVATTYTLTAVWTMPAGYVDAVDPIITVVITVYVNEAQTAP